MSNLLRVALIGKTGAGKSRCGNTILGEKVFKSSSAGSSVTEICQVRNGIANGRSISIVDSPGLNDTRTENQDKILTEIKRCIYLSAPGPHAICFVVQIGRFTTEDIDTIKAFVRHFGEALYKYVIVIFTKFDDYKRDCEDNEEECDIKNYIETLPLAVKEFIVEKCGSRIIGFDNTLKGDELKRQVTVLLEKVDKMVAENGHTYYSNDDFNRAEAVIKKEMETEKHRLEQEMKLEIEQRQKDIDAAANEMVKANIRTEMEAFEMEMEEKMSAKNLRQKVQESVNGFETFRKIITAVAPLLEALSNLVINNIR